MRCFSHKSLVFHNFIFYFFISVIFTLVKGVRKNLIFHPRLLKVKVLFVFTNHIAPDYKVTPLTFWSRNFTFKF